MYPEFCQLHWDPSGIAQGWDGTMQSAAIWHCRVPETPLWGHSICKQFQSTATTFPKVPLSKYVFLLLVGKLLWTNTVEI